LRLDSHHGAQGPSPFTSITDLDQFANAVVSGFFSIIEPFIRFKLQSKSTEEKDKLLNILKQRFYKAMKENRKSGDIGRYLGIYSYTKL